MDVLTLKLGAIQVLGVSGIGVILGIWLRKRIAILDRLHIPAPVVGGLVFALATLLLRDRYVNFDMDLVLREVIMVAFFTTIGMSASLRLLRVGGPQVLLFFLLATLGVLCQNILGVALSQVFSLSPLLGLVSGSVSMAGGPATALAFGGTFEQMGVAGASTLGVAAAMFGIVAGGLIGGYAGGWLIRRHNLKPPEPASGAGRKLAGADAIIYAGDASASPKAAAIASEEEAGHSALMYNAIALAIAMGIGTLISMGLQRLGMTLPSYVGAMLAAAVIRNLDDRYGVFRISQRTMDEIGTVSLYFFIVMALLTLQLWELAHLALPLFLMLIAQVLLVGLLCVTVAFRVMGRDYEAAVMAGGFCGFMLGTSANALACMDVLTQKYGLAPRAFIVVPLVGAFLIDFTNALIIANMTDFVRYFLLQ